MTSPCAEGTCPHGVDLRVYCNTKCHHLHFKHCQRSNSIRSKSRLMPHGGKVNEILTFVLCPGYKASSQEYSFLLGQFIRPDHGILLWNMLAVIFTCPWYGGNACCKGYQVQGETWKRDMCLNLVILKQKKRHDQLWLSRTQELERGSSLWTWVHMKRKLCKVQKSYFIEGDQGIISVGWNWIYQFTIYQVTIYKSTNFPFT